MEGKGFIWATGYNLSSRKTETRAQCRSLKQCRWVLHAGFHPRPNCLDAAKTVLGPSTAINCVETPYRRTHWSSRRRQCLQWGFLFLGVSGWQLKVPVTDKVSFYGFWFLFWTWKRKVLKSKENEGGRVKVMVQKVKRGILRQHQLLHIYLVWARLISFTFGPFIQTLMIFQCLIHLGFESVSTLYCKSFSMPHM